MARPKDNNKKGNDYRGGSSLLKKQQEANTKKFQAMTPTQKKSYVAKQAKAIGKTTAQVASMVGGAGLARKAVAKAAIPAIKKTAAKSVERKSLKAANTLAKGKKATEARARGQKYQDTVDSNLGFKNKDLRARRKIEMVRKGPGWIGGNSYIKLPKNK